LAQGVSAALAAPGAAAQPSGQRQPVRTAEETRGRAQTQRRWLGMSVTPFVTIFRLLQTRSAAEAKDLWGAVVWGRIGTDPYAGYPGLAPRQRPLGWVQLPRDFVAWSERAGETARSGLAV